PGGVAEQEHTAADPDQLYPSGSERGLERGADQYGESRSEDEAARPSGPGRERPIPRRERDESEARPVDQLEAADHGEDDDEAVQERGAHRPASRLTRDGVGSRLRDARRTRR